MTLEIRINLAKPPNEAPWNFPHQCLSIAFRIKAALDVLEGVEPWGKDEVASAARFLAYHHLYELTDSAHYLFRMPDGSQSAFDAALKVIDVKYKRDWYEGQQLERSMEGAKASFRDVSAVKSTMTQVDLSKLKEEFLGHAQRLENIGVYFLRMMQAASGANLPEEHVVQAEVRPTQWGPILE